MPEALSSALDANMADKSWLEQALSKGAEILTPKPKKTKWEGDTNPASTDPAKQAEKSITDATGGVCEHCGK